MREIEFRVWDSIEKTMIPADCFGFDDYAPLSMQFSEAQDRMVFMQYTGLKDKNGMKIYEGDIWRDEADNITFVCEYNEVKAMYEWVSYGFKGAFLESGWDEEAGGFGEIERESFDAYTIDNIEIVANIHDNAELLKGVER